MPRKHRASANPSTSAFRLVQQQARSLMGNLRKEIRAKEIELRRLKEEESRLSMLIGGHTSPARIAAARTALRGGRVNWLSVLDQLPRQFTASDVHRIRGLERKRPSEVFAAITRWIEMGSARRKARGMYERV
ncbi:MAG TPA: hypothetical protein VKV03_10860 [Candidatus Binataceae bacterium]|nr:hypothetical protein [Candidatus Binataceae bacterium]